MLDSLNKLRKLCWSISTNKGTRILYIMLYYAFLPIAAIFLMITSQHLHVYSSINVSTKYLWFSVKIFPHQLILGNPHIATLVTLGCSAIWFAWIDSIILAVLDCGELFGTLI